MNEKKELFCCGNLMVVKGVYDVETKEEYYYASCFSCNQIMISEEIKIRKLPQNSPITPPKIKIT